MDSKQGIHVITLANSIIGVSILAMPYCFKQCGIVLSIVLLVFSSVISRLACHFLLKSAIKARLRTFEFLAYHVFGSIGKLFVEVGMIGFLIGTCIAFFVVMGDLGPEIVAELTGTESTGTLRTSILIALAVFCVLPLGLLRNVQSLSVVCILTIAFYVCLVLKIMAESAPHLLLGDWFDKVDYWRPAGILQCIPIFSMALFCQTQLFEIYQALPNPSLDKMNALVRLAVNICTCVYVFVGVFGYIALSHEPTFGGNILLSFGPSFVTDAMKIGFVLSVAFSFPLVIFPCRASLYSLLYKPSYTALHESTSLYIPEGKFKALTLLIVAVSLIVGVLIPNIELVLGLVGSTIGVMICVLFPATCFICLTSKNTNERVLAQLMLFVGIIVMVLGTYANMYAMERSVRPIVTEKPSIIVKELPSLDVRTEKAVTVKFVEQQQLQPVAEVLQEAKKEPPQPEAPNDELPEVKREEIEQRKVPEAKHKVVLEAKRKVVLEQKPEPPRQEENEMVPEAKHEPPQPEAPKEMEKRNENEKEAEVKKPIEEVKLETPQIVVETKKSETAAVTTMKKPDEVVDIEAIKKEDREMSSSADKKENPVVQQLVEQNQRLMDALQQREHAKIEAVKRIEDFAKMAIANIVDDGKPKPQNRSDNSVKKLAPLPLLLAKNTSNAPANKSAVNIVGLLKGTTIKGRELRTNATQKVDEGKPHQDILRKRRDIDHCEQNGTKNSNDDV